jgi:mono/diheme cytochrome c family protein
MIGSIRRAALVGSVTLLGALGAMMAVSWSFALGDEEEWKAPARASRKENPIPADDKSVATGKDLYTKECYSCHGTKGKGDGPGARDLTKNPGDLSKPEMWKQTDGALFWKITEGKKPMPSMEKTWSEDQRWNVVNYVRTLAPKPPA